MTRAILILCLVVASAHADKPEGPGVGPMLKKAKAAFDIGEYTEAEAILKDAYKLDPQPKILYALAQAQRMAGECDRAAITFQNFLRTNPPADQAKLAQDNLTRCTPKPEPKPEPKVEPKPEPKPEPPRPAPLPPPPPPPAPHGVRWTSNWAGHLLVLGGVGLAAGGSYFALHAQQTIDSLNSAQYYDDFVARQKQAASAQTDRTLGLAAAGLGGALIVAGIVTYVVRSPGKEAPVVSIGPRGEVGVAWGF